jgi:hypothetical protein
LLRLLEPTPVAPLLPLLLLPVPSPQGVPPSQLAKRVPTDMDVSEFKGVFEGRDIRRGRSLIQTTVRSVLFTSQGQIEPSWRKHFKLDESIRILHSIACTVVSVGRAFRRIGQSVV